MISGAALCDVVFAEDVDGCRLGTLLALSGAEANLGALLELAEFVINNAVAMKIDL